MAKMDNVVKKIHTVWIMAATRVAFRGEKPKMSWNKGDVYATICATVKKEKENEAVC